MRTKSFKTARGSDFHKAGVEIEDRVPRRSATLDAVNEESDLEALLSGVEARVDREIKEVESSDAFRCGLLAVDPSEPANVGGVDELPPPALRISQWNRYADSLGTRVWIPKPSQLKAILDGRAVDIPKEVGSDFVIGMPSFQGLGVREMTAVVGRLSTLLASKLIESQVEIPKAEKGEFPKANVKGDAFGYAKGDSIQDKLWARRCSEDVAENSPLKLANAEIEDGKVVGFSEFPDLAEMRSGGMLDALLEGMIQREAELSASLQGLSSKDMGLHLFSECSIGGIGFGGRSDSAMSKVAIEKMFGGSGFDGVPVGRSSRGTAQLVAGFDGHSSKWDGREFAYFLRRLDLEVLRPLGVRDEQAAFISKYLTTADRGFCHPASAFMAKCPGGADGFCSFLEKLVDRTLAIDSIDLNPGPEVELSYEYPSGAERMQEDFSKRSSFMERSSKASSLSESLGRKTLTIAFPSVAHAVRRGSTSYLQWPEAPDLDTKKGEKESTYSHLAAYLKQVPKPDTILEFVRQKVESLESHSGAQASPTLWDAVEKRVEKLRMLYDCGMSGSMDLRAAEVVLTGKGSLTCDCLPSAGREMREAAHAGRFESVDDVQKSLQRAATYNKKRETILKNLPLRFRSFRPLDDFESLQVFSKKKADAMVGSWVSRHSEFVEPAKLSADAKAKVENFLKVAGSVKDVFASIEVDEAFPMDDHELACEILEDVRAGEIGESQSTARFLAAARLIEVLPMDHAFVGGETEISREVLELAALPAGALRSEMVDRGLIPDVEESSGELEAFDRAVALRGKAQTARKLRGKVGLSVQRLRAVGEDLFREYPYAAVAMPGLLSVSPRSLADISDALGSGAGLALVKTPLKTVSSVLDRASEMSDRGVVELEVALGKAQSIRDLSEEWSKDFADVPLATSFQSDGGKIGGIGGAYYSVLSKLLPHMQDRKVEFDPGISSRFKAREDWRISLTSHGVEYLESVSDGALFRPKRAEPEPGPVYEKGARERSLKFEVGMEV